MNRVILVDLDGQATSFRLHEDAYDALSRYLDQSRARLANDPDQAEVMSDLEQSIGAKLTDRLAGADRILTADDVTAVLGTMGSVDPAPGITATPPSSRRPRKRRLVRIREGQQIAGVCEGLSAYSEIRVDWVRTIFFFGTILTAGALLVVYIVLAFVLPIMDTREEWFRAMDAADRAATA